MMHTGFKTYSYSFMFSNFKHFLGFWWETTIADHVCSVFFNKNLFWP